MTHTQILLRELAVHGQTTYRELNERYGDRGYTYGGFREAVKHLRRKGIIAPGDRHRYHRPILFATEKNDATTNL